MFEVTKEHSSEAAMGRVLEHKMQTAINTETEKSSCVLVVYMCDNT